MFGIPYRNFKKIKVLVLLLTLENSRISRLCNVRHHHRRAPWFLLSVKTEGTAPDGDVKWKLYQIYFQRGNVRKSLRISVFKRLIS